MSNEPRSKGLSRSADSLAEFVNRLTPLYAVSGTGAESLARDLHSFLPAESDPLVVEKLAQGIWILAGGLPPLPEVVGVPLTNWGKFLSANHQQILKSLQEESARRRQLGLDEGDLGDFSARLFVHSTKMQNEQFWRFIAMTPTALDFLFSQDNLVIRRKLLAHIKRDMKRDDSTGKSVFNAMANAVFHGQLSAKEISTLRESLIQSKPANFATLSGELKLDVCKKVLGFPAVGSKSTLHFELAEWFLEAECTPQSVQQVLVRECFTEAQVDKMTKELLGLCKAKKLPKLESALRESDSVLLEHVAGIVSPLTIYAEICEGDRSGIASSIRDAVPQHRQTLWESAKGRVLRRIFPDEEAKHLAQELRAKRLEDEVQALKEQERARTVQHERQLREFSAIIATLESEAQRRIDLKQADQSAIERNTKETEDRATRAFLLRIADAFRGCLVQTPDMYPMSVLKAVEAVIPDLELIGFAGEHQPYDGSQHDALGVVIPRGEIVTIIHPGYRRSSNGDVLRRAVVEIGSH